MGAAARKIDQDAHFARPALRLVNGARRGTRTRASLRASRAFRVALMCLLVISFAGVARVSLAVSAAEASIDAWNLRAEVKAERLLSRTLESDRSSLAAPSRIEAIASQTLNMGRPAQVSYLQLPETSPPADDVAPDDTPGGMLGTLVDLAAGEAQVMLVGDVGLGSVR